MWHPRRLGLCSPSASCSSSSAGARPGLPRCPVYLELAYLPGSASAQKVDEDFFRCVRSQCYVISGEDHLKESVLRGILDALLSGKQHWAHDTQVVPGRELLCHLHGASAATPAARGL